jgi:hypothetical protein
VRCFKRSRSRKIKNYPAIPRSTSHLRFDFSGCLFYLYSVGMTDCNVSWGRSSAGRALEWHSRGRRFDPDRLHQRFHGVSDPNEERISRIVTTFVTEPPSVVDSVLTQTALSRTSPHSMSTHPLWLALNRKIGNRKSLDDSVRSHQHIGRNRQTDLLSRLQIDDELKFDRLLDG